MSMNFTEAQIQEFNENGYYIARGLFDAEEMKYLLEVAEADPMFSAAGGSQDAAGKQSRISLENYAVDEQWACLYPYGVHTKPAAIQPFEVKLTNHSPKPRDYRVRFRLPVGARLVSKNPDSALIAHNVPPGGLAALPVKIQLPARPGNYLVRVDVQSDGIDVRDWVESLVTIDPDKTNAPE